MGLTGAAANFGGALSTEQRVASLERATERLQRAVDGDISADVPSIRYELRAIRSEIQQIRQDIETHHRRDMWIHVFQFVTEAVVITLLIVILFAAVTS